MTFRTAGRSALSVCLVLAIVGLLLWMGMWGSTSRSAAQMMRMKEERKATDPVTYSQVMTLREQLYLTNRDLAAMGCSESQAEQVLTSLLAWHEAHQAELESKQSRVRGARSDLREAFQKMHKGPRDASLIRRIPQFESQLESAQRQYHQLVESAGQMATQSTLSSQEQYHCSAIKPPLAAH